MDDKELIRSALLGNKKSQEECTAKGIALPCPFCGKELRERKTRKWTAAKDESINRTIVEHRAKTGCHLDNWTMDKELDLESWNTRPAPPIGRCGECKHFNHFFNEVGHCMIHSQEKDLGGEGYCVEMLKTDFCNYFEPREGE